MTNSSPRHEARSARSTGPTRSRAIPSSTGSCPRKAPPGERAEKLASLIRAEAAELFASPRDQAAYQVLEAAYLRPSEKQEAAAARLGMGYSTFRRHLARATERLVGALYQRTSGHWTPG